MAKKIINFSAGPSKIPDEVKNIMYEEFLDYKNTQSNICELSHRSEYFIKIVANAKSSLKQIFNIPPSYEILFVQGGATGQFAAIPLNLLKNLSSDSLLSCGPDYMVTGQWSAKAAKEAKSLLGKDAVNVINPISTDVNANLLSSPYNDNHKENYPKHETFNPLIKFLSSKLNPAASYFYYCSNETIEGFELNDSTESKGVTGGSNFLDELEEAYHLKWERETPPQGATPKPTFKMPIIVADMSSNFCTKPIDISRYGLIYAGAQKNIGIAGITVVIVRKDLINPEPFCQRPIPSIMDYDCISKAGSLPNTPPVYSVYALDHTLAWILRTGVHNNNKGTTEHLVHQDTNGHGVKGDNELSSKPCKSSADISTISNGFERCVTLENVADPVKSQSCLRYWEAQSLLKSGLIYDVIDRSEGFYRLICPLLDSSSLRRDGYLYLCYRSRINISFKISHLHPQPKSLNQTSPVDSAVVIDLEKEFIDRAKSEGMLYLKGHRSVGGLRASLFNSITVAETKRLATFMDQFWREHVAANDSK